MVNIVKRVTNIQKMCTYFEFQGHDGWDEFDNLLSILVNQMNSNVLRKLDGIWSRHCLLELDDFTFELMHHEDFGNCLCNQEKKMMIIIVN